MVKSSDFEGQEAQKGDQNRKNRSLLTLKHHTCVSHQPFHSTVNENPIRALTLQGDLLNSVLILDTPPPFPTLKKGDFFSMKAIQPFHYHKLLFYNLKEIIRYIIFGIIMITTTFKLQHTNRINMVSFCNI